MILCVFSDRLIHVEEHMPNIDRRKLFEELQHKQQMRQEQREKAIEELTRGIEHERNEIKKRNELISVVKEHQESVKKKTEEFDRLINPQEINIVREIKRKEASSESQYQIIQKERADLIESLGLPQDLKQQLKERFGLTKPESLEKIGKKPHTNAHIRNASRSSRRGWLPMR